MEGLFILPLPLCFIWISELRKYMKDNQKSLDRAIQNLINSKEENTSYKDSWVTKTSAKI